MEKKEKSEKLKTMEKNEEKEWGGEGVGRGLQ